MEFDVGVAGVPSEAGKVCTQTALCKKRGDQKSIDSEPARSFPRHVRSYQARIDFSKGWRISNSQ
jgi:hypothetical protein